MPSSARPFFLFSSCLLSACVGYEAHPADPATISAEVAERTGGTFTIERALATALRQNADLRRLEAEARAAAAARDVPLQINGELRGRANSIGAMLDPVAWLGLGPRGGRIAVGEALHLQALTALAEARWRVAGDVLACFLIEAGLSKWSIPDLDIDGEAFAGAGLASPVTARRLRAAQLRAVAERQHLARSRADNRDRLRELLALPATAELELAPIADGWLVEPAGTAADVLARPDLAMAAARFEVADADFRRAVADQYPSVQIGPSFSLTGDPTEVMGMFTVPFAMDGLAEAARERREAARTALEHAFLAADREARDSDRRLATLAAEFDAASSNITAGTAEFATARVALDVEPDAFEGYVRAAAGLLRDTHEMNEAVVALARARADRARAYGWPGAREEEAR